MKWHDYRNVCLVLFAWVLALANSGHSRTVLKFGIPTNSGPVLMTNSSSREGNFCISDDGLELYVGSDRGGGHGGFDIWVATRETVSASWGLPVNLGATVNGWAEDGSPYLTSDGLALYFSSNRPGGQGNADIWVTTRASVSSPWMTPVNLGADINTFADEFSPVISADGLELYFSEYTVPHPSGLGGGDIWVTKRVSVSDSWGEVENLGPVVNSSLFEAVSSIAPDGLSLLIGSTGRAGGYGVEDMWLTTRRSRSEPWGTPVNLGPSVNSSGWDAHPVFCWRGSILYFLSSRYGTEGYYDIWQVSVSAVSSCDLDENGLVDMRDFAIFAENWLTAEPENVENWPFSSYPDYCTGWVGC